MEVLSQTKRNSIEELLRCSPIAELIEFREFLHDHLSNELLSFWLEAQDYKLLEDKKDLGRRAFDIFGRYFGKGSPYELNIPGSLRERLKEKMKDPDPNIFDEIEKVVLKMLAEGALPQFKASERYKSLKQNGGNTLTKPRNSRSYTSFAKYLEARDDDDKKSKAEEPKDQKEQQQQQQGQQGKESQVQQAESKQDTHDYGKRMKKKQFLQSFGEMHPIRMTKTSVVSRSFASNKFGTARAPKRSDEFNITVMADDLMMSTRVRSDITCDQFLNLQKKKVKFDESKTYGLFLIKANCWMDPSMPLFFYKAFLTDSKEIVEMKPIEEDPESSSSSSFDSVTPSPVKSGILSRSAPSLSVISSVDRKPRGEDF